MFKFVKGENMQHSSPTCLQRLRKLGTILIAGLAIALASCGGGVGGKGGSTPGSTPGITVTESVLYSFAGGTADGTGPTGSLIQGIDGNFYGVTQLGGANNLGTVFSITPAGVETLLYSFAGGTDGNGPLDRLVQASDGNFYGITNTGGTSNLGTVFKITTDGTAAGTTEAVLHSFAGGTTDGSGPTGGLIQASDGKLYGLVGSGGTSSYGGIFNITTGGTFALLYSFAGGTDAWQPNGSLIQASDGNLYGASISGGTNSRGTVFRVTTTGTAAGTTETLLYSFAGGSTGSNYPTGRLIQASDGNLYGMTNSGGASNLGTVFRITLTRTVTKTVLHSFAGGTTDGANPFGGLIQASDGYLYGMTTTGGGSGNNGTVFRINTGGTESVLHFFTGIPPDGAAPYGSLIQASDGNLYGMTFGGGANRQGTVIKIQ